MRAAVHEATLDLLQEGGIHHLTVRQIADRAGVAETTIYRRWGTSTALAAEAVASYAEAHNHIPDTGALESDLLEFLRNVVALLEQPKVRRILRFTLSLDDSSRALTEARNQFWRSRFETGAQIVGSAVARGEARGEVDGVTVIEVLVGAAYMRTLLLERPVDEKLIRDSVAAAMSVAIDDP